VSISGNLSVNREMGKITADLGNAHFRRMTFAVTKDEIPDMVNVRFLGAVTEVSCPDQVPYLIEQFRVRERGFGDPSVKKKRLSQLSESDIIRFKPIRGNTVFAASDYHPHNTRI